MFCISWIGRTGACCKPATTCFWAKLCGKINSALEISLMASRSIKRRGETRMHQPSPAWKQLLIIHECEHFCVGTENRTDATSLGTAVSLVRIVGVRIFCECKA